jgi:hypothetical protein
VSTEDCILIEANSPGDASAAAIYHADAQKSTSGTSGKRRLSPARRLAKLAPLSLTVRDIRVSEAT